MEFSSLQVGEFYKMLEGRRTTEKYQDEKRAYFLSWMLSTQTENPVLPGEILAPIYPEYKEALEEQKAKQRKEDEDILRKEFGLE